MPLPYQLRIRCQHRYLDDAADVPSTSSTSQSSSPPVKSKSHSWRIKQKTVNPAKYEEVKRKNRAYSQYYRLQCSTAAHRLTKRGLSSKERAEAELWQRRHERNNEAARKRMKKMNERKKAATVTSATGTGATTKAVTRKEAKLKREKERIKKQKQRAKMSMEQKEAERRKNRERYAKKKDAILEAKKRELELREQHLRELERQLQAKDLEVQGIECSVREHNMAMGEEVVDLRTDEARRKSLQRARKAMPTPRSHFVSTAIDLVSKASPKKVAAMAAAGLQTQSGDQLENGIMDAITEALKAPRHAIGRKKLAASLSSLKKRKMLRKAACRFGVSRKLLAKAKKDTAGRKSCSPATVKLIEQFYESHANILPEKKYVSKATGKPRHIIANTIAVLHKEYNEAHPDAQVSRATFYKHRPKHVRTMQAAKYSGCLCEYCENVNLKLTVINRLQPGCVKDAYELVSYTMCDRAVDMQFNKPACIKRTCNECGVDKLDSKLGPILKDPTKEIEWKCWEMVFTTCYSNNVAKQVKKRGLVTKTGTITAFVSELKGELQPFTEHLFNKDWQHKQELILRAKLRKDEVLGIFDFAENYKCGYQREVQSAYYSHDSATVHPIVLYYTCSECQQHVSESCVMVSNDITHDYNLVNKFQSVVSTHLQTTRSLSIQTFYRFSDGCSAQYKSKGPISDISYGVEDYGYTIHHNYSGTRHGKGASDGESGVVKRLASDAVKAGTAIINNAKSLSDFLSQKATKEAPAGRCCLPFRRSIFYVPFEDVARERPNRAIKTVAGTRRLHSVKSIEGGVVATRNLSCFCNSCQDNRGVCDNQLYVEPWRKVQLEASNPSKYQLHCCANISFHSPRMYPEIFNSRGARLV